MKFKKNDLVIILDPKTVDTFEYNPSSNCFFDRSIRDSFVEQMFNEINTVCVIEICYPNGRIYLKNKHFSYYAHWLKKATVLDYYLLKGER